LDLAPTGNRVDWQFIDIFEALRRQLRRPQ